MLGNLGKQTFSARLIQGHSWPDTRTHACACTHTHTHTVRHKSGLVLGSGYHGDVLNCAFSCVEVEFYTSLNDAIWCKETKYSSHLYIVRSRWLTIGHIESKLLTPIGHSAEKCPTAQQVYRTF